MATKSTVIVDKLAHIVEMSVREKRKETEFVKHITDYYDRNSELLFTPYPINKLFFMDADKAAIYKFANLDPKMVKKTIKETGVVKDSWKILNEPLNITCTLIMRYYAKKGDKKMLGYVATFYSCYFYSSIYHKYFRHGANEEVMKYTVNELTNKYKLKTHGSVYKAIEATTEKCIETYYKDLISGDDEYFVKIISGIKLRLNDFMKNIKREFTANHAAGKYLHQSRDEVTDTTYLIADSNSFGVKSKIDSCMSSISRNGADTRLSNLSSQITDVSKAEISNVISRIIENDMNEVAEFISMLLELFVSDGNDIKNVNTKMFLAKSLEIYKKANTLDRVVIDMKKMLDAWLNKYSDKYRRINSPSTINNFRKAIFIYFVLVVQVKS